MPFFTFRQSITGLLLLSVSTISTRLTAQSLPPTPPVSQTVAAPIPPPPLVHVGSTRDTLRELLEAEEQRLMDPALRRVPHERLADARKTILVRKNPGVTTNGVPNVNWDERGPSNAGSRTRSLLFDPNDPTHKKVWAGSTTGGLWFNPDITNTNANWTPVSDDWENTLITAIAADPSNPQVMYAGTGDTYDNRAGGGIWKTSNGGQSWARLTSTIPGGTAPAVSQAFNYIQRIVVNNTGQVFVATQYGVVRSTDGGNSWAYALAPAQGIGTIAAPGGSFFNDKVTDLEIGSDGVLYVAFYPSKIYKSAGGSAWSDITPVGAPTGERTELALAPSTSGAGQVVYAVTRKYNPVSYGQDVLWFKKSIDAGGTWTDLSIPAFSANYHFTDGNGYRAMSLAVHPNDPTVVYAGGYNWFRSLDGGSSWIQLPNKYYYQHGLQFQPGSTVAAALTNEGGVYWSADWGQTSVTQPAVLDRNSGYRTGTTKSVAMKASPGSPYLLTSTAPLGIVKSTGPGVSTGSVVYNSTYEMGLTFIDEEDPNVQVFTSNYGSCYFYNGSGWQTLFSPQYGYSSVDYDSPANTLYIQEYLGNNQYGIRKLTGVGSGAIGSTSLPLAGITSSMYFFKLSKDRTALFMGGYPGKLYKVTNLNQATPTVTNLDNGAFPAFTTVSSIDVGATDNELLVTLSNYGVKSVWYTNNGGSTWTSKDEPAHGLPDMPVRSVLFNPQNYKQVLLGTELGVWSSNDITAANPEWSYSSARLGGFPVNQLRYRASDGRVSAATTGRGTFTSDVFAVPYTLPTITLTGVSTNSMCAGSAFTVSFSTSGPAFAAGNQFEVWVSDASGSFANATRIGSGTSSPVSATLPANAAALPYGTNYRVKIIATNPDVESGPSDAVAIGDLRYIYAQDRHGNTYGGTVCPNSATTFSARTTTYTNSSTPADQYQWQLNGTDIAGATGATYTATQAGNYSVKAYQAGCSAGSSGYYPLQYIRFIKPGMFYPSSPLQCEGQSAQIDVRYAADVANYQWYRDNAPISGATSATYVATQSGYYYVYVTDGDCNVTAPGPSYRFGSSINATIYYGNPASDSLYCLPNATSSYLYIGNNSPGETYQWKRNGVNIAGATNNYYYASDAEIYSVTVQKGNCVTTSNALSRVTASSLPVTIEYDGPTTFCPGESRPLRVSSGYWSFQWQKDGVDIIGATSSTYNATATGNYSVRVTKGDCSGTSNAIPFVFTNQIIPKITTGSGPTESCYNVNLYQYEYYNGTGTLPGYTYQWQKDGVDISGATNRFMTNTSATGLYTLKTTNGSCSGISKGLYVRVGTPTKPLIRTDPDRSRCPNNSVQLYVNNFSNGSLRWKRNGVLLTGIGTTSSSYYATESGTYSVVLTQNTCQSESDPVTVTIGEPTSATLTGSSLVAAGQPASLAVAFSGPGPWSFKLTDGTSVSSVRQNPYLLTVTPSATTTYSLSSVANGCGMGNVTGSATVTIGTGNADVSLAMSVSNRAPDVNEMVEYTLHINNTSDQQATGVQAQMVLPTGLAVTEIISPGVSVDDGVITVNAGTIAPNSSMAFNFRLKATQPGIFATAAQITASQTPDPDSQPNSGTGDGEDDAVVIDLRTADQPGQIFASANLNQRPLPRVAGNQPVADADKADLSLAVGADKRTVATAQNEVVTTTFTIINRGSVAASNVVVQVSLPNGSTPGTLGWVAVDSQTYKSYVNQLPAGGTTTLTLRWQPTGDGTLKAQVLDVTETDPDSTPGNGYTNGEDDEASVSVRVR